MNRNSAQGMVVRAGCSVHLRNVAEMEKPLDVIGRRRFDSSRSDCPQDARQGHIFTRVPWRDGMVPSIL